MDVHIQTAESIWKRKPSKTERDLVKQLEYGANYGAQAEKLWQTLSPAFPTFTLKAAAGFIRQWFLDHPEIKEYHELLELEAQRTWAVEERLSGRKEYFHEGVIDRNMLLNFPIQGFAGTLINRAVIALNAELDWKEDVLIIQCHDELVLDTTNIQRAATMLRKHMEQEITLGGHTMKFPVEIKAGKNWKDREPVSC